MEYGQTHVELEHQPGMGYQTSGFFNDFSQATLVEGVYTALPYYFDSDNGEYRAEMVMKLNKILYVVVQYPLYWYNNLKVGFESRGFKPVHMYPCMLYIRGMVSLIYVDDLIVFGPDQDNID